MAQRGQWGVPEGEQIVYDAADFTTGGVDAYRCGPPGDLSTVGSQRYHLIDPPHRMIYTDTVLRDGELLAVALLTWTLEPTGQGTRLTVIDQVASLARPGMIDGHRNGHQKTLDQLIRWLAR